MDYSLSTIVGHSKSLIIFLDKQHPICFHYLRYISISRRTFLQTGDGQQMLALSHSIYRQKI